MCMEYRYLDNHLLRVRTAIWAIGVVSDSTERLHERLKDFDENIALAEINSLPSLTNEPQEPVDSGRVARPIDEFQKLAGIDSATPPRNDLLNDLQETTGSESVVFPEKTSLTFAKRAKAVFGWLSCSRGGTGNAENDSADFQESEGADSSSTSSNVSQTTENNPYPYKVDIPDVGELSCSFPEIDTELGQTIYKFQLKAKGTLSPVTCILLYFV